MGVLQDLSQNAWPIRGGLTRNATDSHLWTSDCRAGSLRRKAETKAAKMKAYHVAAPGRAPELCDIAVPEPGPGQVRVRIAACGLNAADNLVIEGRYQERPTPPYTVGMELAGTVEALGEGVSQPAIGTRVAVFGTDGGLAEAGVFPASRCLPIPDDMSFEQGAAFQVAYASSHMALARRAGLRAGETLLVTGAGGGVGLTAVEVGKLMGARVIAAARGQDRLSMTRRLGADLVIDLDSATLREQLRAVGGVDVAFEMVGGEVFSNVLSAMKPEGRLLVIGFAGGTIPQVPANLLLVKNVSAIGFYLGGYRAFNPAALRDSLDTLLAWFNEGRIAPQISRIIPLSRVDEAFAALKSRSAIGKIVVRCDQAA